MSLCAGCGGTGHECHFACEKTMLSRSEIDAIVTQRDALKVEVHTWRSVAERCERERLELSGYVLDLDKAPVATLGMLVAERDALKAEVERLMPLANEPKATPRFYSQKLKEWKSLVAERDALKAEVERLQQAEDYHCDTIRQLAQQVADTSNERDDLKAEVERLSAEVDLGIGADDQAIRLLAERDALRARVARMEAVAEAARGWPIPRECICAHPSSIVRCWNCRLHAALAALDDKGEG